MDRYIEHFCEIDLRCMPQDLSDDLSTLVQVMAWCHQATSHYLSQCSCWPWFMSPYGVTRPHWVNWVEWTHSLYDTVTLTYSQLFIFWFKKWAKYFFKDSWCVTQQKHSYPNFLWLSDAIWYQWFPGHTGQKNLFWPSLDEFTNGFEMMYKARLSIVSLWTGSHAPPLHSEVAVWEGPADWEGTTHSDVWPWLLT